MVADRLGVLAFNLGGPSTLSEIPRFLYRLLSDPAVVSLPWPIRQFVAWLVSRFRSSQVAGHYRAIGGKSPIDGHTRAQVDALQTALGERYVVRHAFRHSDPSLERAVEELRGREVRRVVALPLFPQWSRSTTGSAMTVLSRVTDRCKMELRQVHSYPDGAGYIEALAKLAEPLLAGGPHVVMSAHGLPERDLGKGEPYVDHVRRTAAALAARLGPAVSHSLAFQSRLGPVEWVKPYLTDEIERLGRSGVRSLAIVPLSFVCENLETLFELDIQAAELAARCGVTTYRRVPAPGSHPAFIEELASLSVRAAREAGWEGSP